MKKVLLSLLVVIVLSISSFGIYSAVKAKKEILSTKEVYSKTMSCIKKSKTAKKDAKCMDEAVDEYEKIINDYTEKLRKNVYCGARRGLNRSTVAWEKFVSEDFGFITDTIEMPNPASALRAAAVSRLLVYKSRAEELEMIYDTYMDLKDKKLVE